MDDKRKISSHWRGFDSHKSSCSPRRSLWLQSTLSELDEKTKAILKLIEEDACSFAQLAEMYYKKRPELITMVEDFYRAHRSLAERYDQVKSESGTRLPTSGASSPLSLTKYQPEKFMSSMDKSYDSYSETDDPEESVESEVEDPEQEEETQVLKEVEEDEVSSGVGDEVMKLRKEIERLKEENKIQKEELMQKDEEKREVIRQLSLAVDILKEENAELKKKGVAKEFAKNQSTIQFNKLKEAFLGKLFNVYPKSSASIIAL